MSKYLESNQTTKTTASTDQQSCIYDLFAVCNHKGQNMANGHYTAFCKSLIDTQWYCYDDASCTPVFDVNIPQNGLICANGASGVCTENAYILFYKRRYCMRQERWWKSHIDRTLFEYDDFYLFLQNLDQIERQQQAYQHKKQLQLTSQNSAGNLQQLTTLPKQQKTGLKTLGRMLLGSTTNPSRIEENQQQLEVENCYDEVTRPKRLIKQSQTASTSINSSLNILGGGEESRASSISLSTSPLNSTKPNSSDGSQASPGRVTSSSYGHNLNQANSNYLNYPNDNDYTPRPTPIDNQRDGNIYQSDFFYKSDNITAHRQQQPTSNAVRRLYQQHLFHHSATSASINDKDTEANKTTKANPYMNATSIETHI
jgi:hypothetical protein